MIWTHQSVMFNMTQSANLRFNYGQASKRSAPGLYGLGEETTKECAPD
jgi:hypothetical protein